MATSKLLKPTNVTISIPEFTDQPDQRVNSNCIDKEADAINSLSEHLANTCYADHSSGTSYTIPLTGYTSGNYWVALMYAQTGAYSYGLYLIFLNTSDAVFVNALVTNGGRTFTGQRSGNNIVLTANDTVWGGIRVLMMN